MCICMCVCMYVCMYVCLKLDSCIIVSPTEILKKVMWAYRLYMYVCRLACVSVCMYVYMFEIRLLYRLLTLKTIMWTNRTVTAILNSEDVRIVARER
jgi:hypothetical protein